MFNQTPSHYEADFSKADDVYYAYVQNFDDVYKLFDAVGPNLRKNRTKVWLVQSERAIEVDVEPLPLIKQIRAFASLVDAA